MGRRAPFFGDQMKEAAPSCFGTPEERGQEKNEGSASLRDIDCAIMATPCPNIYDYQTRICKTRELWF
jgi:hypothetical protein